jgi:hypothetical protein
VKSLLYTFRVALTGIHLLRTGEVVANLPTLLELHPVAGVRELIDRKVHGLEKAAMSEADSAPYRAMWPAIGKAMEAALAASPLPEEPRNTDEIERWLVGVRRRGLSTAR